MEQVFAQVSISDVFEPAGTFSTFGSIVSVIVRNAVVIAAIIFFALLILGGFGIIVGAGSGDTKKLEEGKKAITGAVIGLIIVLFSVVIVQVVGTLTGLSAINNMLPK